MTVEPALRGQRILVVEDEYFIATDTARTLREAGAAVIGPVPSEEAARLWLARERPDAAVLDINLGLGASFTLAGSLKERGIPFVFVTGYDQSVIPAAFGGVERLEKPIQIRRIVGALSKLLMQTA
ncbi:response regulator [Methylobacterium organophilum]|uniref:response regulator n=1 Tax=Methylobacterium organophilum TaxID=410 RepID=UPI001F13B266|nr:response regulator [Methylobacterium organophilum]UMY19760.1 response regulator [Methylobacterium organophilum]